ncbi:MAG: DUF452 family protein, partial [Prevotella sp.]|nr:DUF452 family protein [Prevotella sp.]
MNNRYISTTVPTESRLLLIFTGWSTDHNHLRELQMPGWDIAVIYDYSTPIINGAPDFNRYDEIAVIAWSFGVPVATVFLKENQHLPVTCTIAVNGTLYPVDDLRGIPHVIFNATRD